MGKIQLSEYFWSTIFIRAIALTLTLFGIEMLGNGNVISASISVGSGMIVYAIAEYIEVIMMENRVKMMMSLCKCPCHYPQSIRKYLGIEVAKHHKCLCKKEVEWRNDDKIKEE